MRKLRKSFKDFASRSPERYSPCAWYVPVKSGHCVGSDGSTTGVPSRKGGHLTETSSTLAPPHALKASAISPAPPSRLVRRAPNPAALMAVSLRRG
ncbi:hypothetical protein G6F24_018738 [Rhizopus arrhizus]|nr:hypothetical protein G6F24_018738 [Rhizopus arrhizus]